METYGVTGVSRGMAGRERALATLLDGVIGGTRSFQVLDILLRGLLADLHAYLTSMKFYFWEWCCSYWARNGTMVKACWLGLAKKCKPVSSADIITTFIDR